MKNLVGPARGFTVRELLTIPQLLDRPLADHGGYSSFTLTINSLPSRAKSTSTESPFLSSLMAET